MNAQSLEIINAIAKFSKEENAENPNSSFALEELLSTSDSLNSIQESFNKQIFLILLEKFMKDNDILSFIFYHDPELGDGYCVANIEIIGDNNEWEKTKKIHQTILSHTRHYLLSNKDKDILCDISDIEQNKLPQIYDSFINDEDKKVFETLKIVKQKNKLLAQLSVPETAASSIPNNKI